MRVSVTGNQDGEPVNHEYSYIDFRPYVAPPSAFEVSVTSTAWALLNFRTGTNATQSPAARMQLPLDARACKASMAPCCFLQSGHGARP